MSCKYNNCKHCGYKSECEIYKENAELEEKLKHAEKNCINKTCVVFKDKEDCVAQLLELEKENTTLKELVEKYRQAVDKCLHITFMGGGCEVNTIGQYATLVDGYLTDVEGLAKWKN
jgi:hypothetical protein